MSTAPSEKEEPKNERYEYHLGSTIYLGANEYEILSFDDERVMLYDKLRELSDREDCEFVLWNGTKRLIKRKKLDEFLERAYSI